MREKLAIPRGERYEMCRSVHAEQNAIISASREEMLGSTLYLVGTSVGTGEYIPGAEPCGLCKRFIINAGIETVVVRRTKDVYEVMPVSDWVENDDSLDGKFGY
jgi:dCMP deaminase